MLFLVSASARVQGVKCLHNSNTESLVTALHKTLSQASTKSLRYPYETIMAAISPYVTSSVPRALYV